MISRLPWNKPRVDDAERAARRGRIKDYVRPVLQVVAGGAAAYALFTYGPDKNIDGLLSLIPLSVAADGMKRISERIKENSIGVELVEGPRSAKNTILVIRVDGVILGEVKRGFASKVMSCVSGYEVQKALMDAAKSKRIKAVLVQFSTPGGTIPGARAISDGIEDYQAETSNPVYAHVEGMSASGGVYAMAGATEIFAEPGSLIGSIGVRLGTHHYYKNPIAIDGGVLLGGVETRDGIETETLAAGEGKDLFSPWRAIAPRERRILQDQLDGMYEEFVTHVSARRGIPPAVIREGLGAYLFANIQAEANRLIDGTKTRRQMYGYVAEKLGILEDYKIVRPRKKGALSKPAGIGVGALTGVVAVYNGPGAQGFFGSNEQEL